MRRFIIDTDTGCDDAVALMMALKEEDIKIEAVTTVCGNINRELATKNALMTIEVTDSQMPPVYPGSSHPLIRPLQTAEGVHGKDGMGDQDLIHPTLKAQEEDAVEVMLGLVKRYPNEIEIVALGPVTNIALAILKDADTMKKVKHIYTMGTAGFGRGNATPVAEFNVYVDAQAYDIMVNAGIPTTVIGFDVALGEAAFVREDIDELLHSPAKTAQFAIACSQKLLSYNQESHQKEMIDWPDAVAMGVALWPEIVRESVPCYAYVCTKEEATYGQVILNDFQAFSVHSTKKPATNVEVCKTLDARLFKEKVKQQLTEQKTLVSAS